MFINVHIIPSHWRTCPYLSIFSYVWSFGVMLVQQLIVGWFKQAFHKMFAKRCRILHTSRIRKRRHKDPSYVRAPSVGLVIVVPHYEKQYACPWNFDIRANWWNKSSLFDDTLFCGMQFKRDEMKTNFGNLPVNWPQLAPIIEKNVEKPFWKGLNNLGQLNRRYD